MTIRSLMTVWLTATVVVPVAHGQANDDYRVLRAAFAFVIDTISPTGALVFDSETLRGNAELVDRMARDLGAARGNSRDLIKCTQPDPTRRPRCSTEGMTIIAFANPVIRSDSAVVVIVWWWDPLPGRFARASMKLQLVQNAREQWSVTRVLLRSIS